MDDLARIRGALRGFEDEASQLPWAHERCWRVRSHTRMEKGLPTIDLHDLDVNLARRIVRRLGDEIADLDAGGLRLITGWGKHSGGYSRLRRAVGDELNTLCSNEGWGFRAGNRGTWILLVDDSQLGPAETGELGLVVYLVGALLLLGLWLVAPPAAGGVVAWLIWRLLRRFRGR